MVASHTDSRGSWTNAVAAALMVAGAAIAAIAILVLFIEGFEWLSSQEWPGLTLADGLSLFGLHHELPESDAQRFTDLLLAAPLSAALFGVGIATILLGTRLGDRAERRRGEGVESFGPAESPLVLLSTEVPAAQFFRILLLDRMLNLFAWIGAVVAALGLLLYALDGEALVAITGGSVVALALLVRLLTRRSRDDG